MLRDDVCQNSRGAVFVIEPSYVLSKDRIEELYAEFKGKIVSTPAKAQYLTKRANSDANDKTSEDYGPNIALLHEIVFFCLRIDRQGQDAYESGKDEAEHRHVEGCRD